MKFIFDIDGTLADCTHRLHWIQHKPYDWGAFFRDCIGDHPIEEVIDLLRELANENQIFIITGRSDEIRDETSEWLLDRGVLFDRMYMRKKGDHREDCVVKSELLDQLLKDCKITIDQIGGMFEDRQQVVDMFRARGLRVYQVAKGDF